MQKPDIFATTAAAKSKRKRRTPVTLAPLLNKLQIPELESQRNNIIEEEKRKWVREHEARFDDASKQLLGRRNKTETLCSVMEIM